MTKNDRALSVVHVTTIPDSLKLLLLDQLRAIAAAGYTVTGMSAPGLASRALLDAGIDFASVPFVRSTALTPGADARATVSMVRAFRRGHFTIVHTHTAKPDLYATIAARLARVPLVVTTLHGFYFDERTPPRRRRMFAQLARLGMRMCDAVLSQNPEDIDTAVAERLCDPEKLVLLGNGIDLKRFDPTNLDRDVLATRRAALGLGTGPVIGYVGRLVREKGIVELLEAFRELLQRHPTAKLLLVGMFDTAKADAISPSIADQLGIADRCVFAGHRDDVALHYALMDVCVLPSHREGFPRTAMEAAAMGVPMVATSIRGCRTAVRDRETGLLVPVNDIAALTGALDALLVDARHRQRLGAAGRELAVKEFDQQRVFSIVLATYARLLARNGRLRV